MVVSFKKRPEMVGAERDVFFAFAFRPYRSPASDFERSRLSMPKEKVVFRALTGIRGEGQVAE